MAYLPRTVDHELDELLPTLAAISLDGPKGVGKTATAGRRASTVLAMDDAGQRQLIQADPDRLERESSPVLVDEWQRLPEVWDMVRRSVDRGAAPGSYLLTGSASPGEGATTHSGAGRIVQVRMRPLTFAERRVEAPTVSLGALLEGAQPDIGGSTTVGLADYTDEILASGLPGVRHLAGRARRAQLDGYLARIVDRDFPEQGHPVRRPRALRAWLTAYAAATSTTAKYSVILDASTAGDGDKPAKTTVIGYRDVLTQLWILDPVPGWVPSRNPFTRLQQSPKHHLADPALAARLLGATEGSLLDGSELGPSIPRDGTLLGALFESLVALSLRVAAQSAEATVHHLRTANGVHEVDFIVERADHRVLAIEVKLAASVEDRDVVHLTWLADQLGSDVVDRVVVTTGSEAYRRRDGIAVVPLALLGV
ncbi:ATP-binding protein [Angustibacter luteus]|uniref:ATP-binding protein n=1 Tax=Angustibacter luteus TaxID=658456 RepID=A0ABW1JHN7_9ACTN